MGPQGLRHRRLGAQTPWQDYRMPSELQDLGPPGLPNLDRFMVAVETARSARTTGEWRELVRRSRGLRQWKHFLALDPYTRWGIVKPCGYAGDATLMDFAYRHPSIQHHIAGSGDIGATIYACTSQAPQSRSARERVALVRDLLRQRAELGGQRVVSLASGHAREFEGLPADVVAGLSRFTPIDSDAASLQVAQRVAKPVHCTPIHCNVVKDDLSSLGQADVVYSLGLFDYLSDAAAVQVLRSMLALTAPGGVCLVANLADDAANLGYCEAIMDWWMVTRTESRLLALARSAAGEGHRGMEISAHRSGCFVYLSLKPTNRPTGAEPASVGGACAPAAL
jgi:SAM-dependent methyltransferase